LNKLLPLLAFSILLLVPIGSQTAFAASITADVTACNTFCFWGSGSSWVGGVIPTVADDATIPSGATVLNGASDKAKTVTVDAGGQWVLNQAGSPVVVEVVDSLTNNGLVVIGPFNGITLKFTGVNPVIDGTGELRMTGPGPGDAAISAPGKTITHESDHLIKVSISGSTNLAKITGNMGSFLNKGTIQVDEGVLVIDPSSPFENTGTMKAKGPNSIIRWNGGPTDVFLQNGQLISENNGRIEFSPGPGVGAVVGRRGRRYNHPNVFFPTGTWSSMWS